MRIWALILSIAVTLGVAPASAAVRGISVVSKSPRVGNLTLYQNSWAVLIGINDYKNKDIPDLKFAEKDVADMRRSLRRLGLPSGPLLPGRARLWLMRGYKRCRARRGRDHCVS